MALMIGINGLREQLMASVKFLLPSSHAMIAASAWADFASAILALYLLFHPSFWVLTFRANMGYDTGLLSLATSA